MHLTRGYDLVSQVQPGDRVLHWQTRAPRGLVGWSEVELISLIGELSTQSEEFRCRWAAHDVRFHRTGRKRLVHPVAGTLDLDFEVMEFPAHPGLTTLAYTAPAGTPTADSLRMLASWAITAEKAGELPAHA